MGGPGNLPVYIRDAQVDGKGKVKESHPEVYAGIPALGGAKVAGHSEHDFQDFREILYHNH